MNGAYEHNESLSVADLSIESERLRLWPPGVSAFFNIAEKWGLNDAETLAWLAPKKEKSLEGLRLGSVGAHRAATKNDRRENL